MSFGKMNGFADIVETRQIKDSEGFTHEKAMGKKYKVSHWY